MRPALLFTILALAAGCASGSDDGERWAEQANGLCRELELELASFDPPREVEEPDDLAAFVSEVARAGRDWLTQMRSLEPAEEDEARVQEMLGSYERAILTTEEAAEALATGDEERYRGLVVEAEKPTARADRIARELGAEVCAFPLSG